jgi:hypothetical protein
VLAALRDWGERHLLGSGAAALALVHRDCGAPVHAHLHCEHGHEIDAPREVVPRPGPGAHRRSPADPPAR